MPSSSPTTASPQSSSARQSPHHQSHQIEQLLYASIPGQSSQDYDPSLHHEHGHHDGHDDDGGGDGGTTTDPNASVDDLLEYYERLCRQGEEEERLLASRLKETQETYDQLSQHRGHLEQQVGGIYPLFPS